MGKIKRKQKPQAPIWHWFNDECLTCSNRKKNDQKNCNSCKSAKQYVKKQKEKALKKENKKLIEESKDFNVQE